MENESQHNKSSSNSSDLESSFSESETSDSSINSQLDVIFETLTQQPYTQPTVSNDANVTISSAYPTLSNKPVVDHCKVCYSSVSSDFLQEDCKHLFELIYCKECHISAHFICNGLATPLEEERDVLGRRIKVFLCDKCDVGTKNKNLSCYICGSKEGYLKLTQDEKWMHTLCGIANSNVNFTDLTSMNADLSEYKKETTRIPAIKKCNLCKSKVETLQCSNEDEEKHCHLHCALRNSVLKSEKNLWKVHFSIARQEGLSLHDLLDDQVVLANLEDIAFGVREIVMESGFARQTYEPLLNIKAKKAPKGYKGKKKMTREDAKVMNLLRGVLRKAVKRTENVFKQKVPADEEEDELQTGGQIMLEYNSEGTEMEEERTNEQDSVRMQYIRELYQELANTDTLLDVYTEDKIPKLRNNLPEFLPMQRLSFPEVLFFINVLQRRVSTACEQLCSLEDIRKLADSIKLIPFSLGSLIKQLNEKYCTGVATDILLKPCVANCKPESAFDLDNKMFKKHLIEKNRVARDQTLEVQKLYFNDSCGVITNLFETALKYRDQLVFLDELYEHISVYYDRIDEDGQIEQAEKRAEKDQPPKGLLLMLSGKMENPGLLRGFAEGKLLEEHTNGSMAVEETPENAEKDAIEEIDEIEPEEENMYQEEKYFEEENRVEKKERPRRVIVRGGDNDEEDEEWAANSEESSPERKRRGRMRKARIDSTKEPKETVNDGQKKKRGRKPKNYVAPKESETEERKDDRRRHRNEASGSPQSPMEDSTAKTFKEAVQKKKGKRGRPARAEKAVKNIEDEFQNDMKTLEEKMTMEEAQEAIENSDSEKNYKDLQRQIKKVLEWKENFEECMERKKFNWNELISQIEDFDINIPEMAQALQEKKAWRLWRNKAEILTRKLKKKIEDIYEESEDIVTIEELEKAMEEADELKYVEDDDAQFEDLRTKVKDVKKVQEMFNKPEEIQTFSFIKDVERKLRILGVKIPEIAILQEKLKANKQLKNLIEETASWQQLEDFHNEIEKQLSIVNEGLYTRLGQKILECKKISKEASRYLNLGSEHKLTELVKMACILKEARAHKVDSAELTEVRALVESFLLLTKIHSILFGGQGLDNEALEAGELNAFQGKGLQDLILSCEKRAKSDGLAALKERQVERLKELCSKFDKLYQECNGTTFQNSLFPLIFTSLSRVLAKRPVNLEKSNSFEKKSDYRRQEQPESRAKEGFLEDKVREWKTEIEEYLRTNPEDAVLEVIERTGDDELNYAHVLKSLRERKTKIEKLAHVYSRGLVQSKELENKNRLIRLIEWMDWTIDAVSMRRQVVEDERQLEARELRSLVQKIDGLRLPKSIGLCKIVTEWHRTSESANRELEKIYSASRPVQYSTRSYLKVKEIVERTKESKVDFEEMIRVDKIVKKAETIVKVSKDSNRLEKDLERYTNWANDVQDLAEQYMQYTEEELESKEKVNRIKRKMEDLKKEMWDLKVRQEIEEITLRLLEWMLKSSDLINSEDKPEKFEEWNEALNEVREFGETEGDGGRVRRLKAKITTEVDKAQKIRGVLKSVRDGKKIEFTEVQEAVECSKTCLVKPEEDQRMLEKVLRECMEVKEKVERLLNGHKNGRRGSMYEFKETSNKLRSLPAVLNEEDEKVSQAIRMGMAIREEALRRARESTEGKRNIEEMKNIVERYDICPVLVQEVERVQNILDEAEVDNMDKEVVSQKTSRLMELLREKKQGKATEEQERRREKEQEREAERRKVVPQGASLIEITDEDTKPIRQSGLVSLLNRDKTSKGKSSEGDTKERKQSLEGKQSVSECEILNKENVKPPRKRSEIALGLNDLFEEAEHLKLSLIDTLEYAKTVMQNFPEILEKEDACVRMMELLKKLMKYQYISKSLVDRKFAKDHLQNLMVLDDNGLNLMEQVLKNSSADKGPQIKKVEKDSNVKKDGLVMTPYRGKEELVRESVNTASTMATEELVTTEKKSGQHGSQVNENNGIVKKLNFGQYNAPFSKGMKETGTNDVVLKIFEGTLKYDEQSRLYQMIAFYTCDSANSVTSVPQIADKEQSELKIEGRISQDRFKTYLEQTFSQWEKKIEKIISGWVDSSISVYHSRCQQMAQDLLNVKKVGMSTYHESSKIFFLHKSQIPDEWKIKLNFQNRALNEKSSPSSLCYIIIHKPYKIKAAVKSISPEVIAVSANTKPSQPVDDAVKIKAEVNNIKHEEQSCYSTNSGKRSLEDFCGGEIHGATPEKKVMLDKDRDDNTSSVGVISISPAKTEGMNEAQVDQSHEDEVKNDQELLLTKLQAMNTEQVVEYTKDISQEQREEVVEVLQEIEFRSKQVSSVSVTMVNEPIDISYNSNSQESRTSHDGEQIIELMTPERQESVQTMSHPDGEQENVLCIESSCGTVVKETPSCCEVVEDDINLHTRGKNDVTRTFETNSCEKKDEEMKVAERAPGTQIQEELKAMHDENKAKFLSLRSNKENLKKNAGVVQPRPEGDVMSHNPLVRQRTKEKLEREKIEAQKKIEIEGEGQEELSAEEQ